MHVAIAIDQVDAFINACNRGYQDVHVAYERNFWATKMNLSGASTQALTSSKAALDAFLGNESTLSQTRQYLALGADVLGAERIKLLQCFEKTFKCYIIESAEARALRERIDQVIFQHCMLTSLFFPLF